MKSHVKHGARSGAAGFLAVLAALSLTACGGHESDINLLPQDPVIPHIFWDLGSEVKCVWAMTRQEPFL